MLQKLVSINLKNTLKYVVYRRMSNVNLLRRFKALVHILLHYTSSTRSLSAMVLNPLSIMGPSVFNSTRPS